MASYLRQVRSFKRDTRLFLVYNLLAYVGYGVFQLIFNLYLKELHLRENDMGAFQSAQTLVMAGAAATMGPVLQRFGIWRPMVAGMVIFLLTSIGLAWSSQPPALLALSAVSGVGLAYLFTTTMPFIISWTPRDQRQHVSTVAFAVIGLSGTLGSLIGGFLPKMLGLDPLWSYRWTLMAGTVLAASALIPLGLMGTSRSPKAPPDPHAAREAVGAAERRQVKLDVTVFVLIGGIMAIGAGMIVPFYNVYLTTLGAGPEQIGLVFAVAGLGAATIGLFAPAVSRRWGALAGTTGVRLAGLPLYAVLLFAPSLWAAILAHIVRQTTISMAWPIDSTFIAEVLPPKARASVYGLRSAAWNLTWAGASLLGGFLIVRQGYALSFALLIGSTLVAMALFVGYYGRHPRVRSGDLPSALPRSRRVVLPSEE
ncbi:MAG: MFS transporter [Thermomicrobiales bacterium]